MDSRLTETSTSLRRDVDQIRKEMEEVVLKEMKQQLEEVYRRVGQEEAARKLVRGAGKEANLYFNQITVKYLAHTFTPFFLPGR